MFYTYENLSRTKRAFENYVKKINQPNFPDANHQYFNVYVWPNKNNRGQEEEIIFSVGYRTPHLANEMADKSNSEPKVANAKQNDLVWLGVLDSGPMINLKKR